jgi:hypothetical protein
VIVASTVLALTIGTTLAEDKPADNGEGKGQEKQATNKGTTAKNKATDSGGKKQNQDTSYAFKGTVAQNGKDGSPLEVKVEKANDVAQSFVGKNLKFAVSSDTEIYLDNADVEGAKLDAKLPDLKSGDKVVIQAKAPENASSFAARLIRPRHPTPKVKPRG